LNNRLDGTYEKLRQIGIVVSSPEELYALLQSNTLRKEQTEEAIKLLTVLLSILAAIKQTNDEQAKDAQHAARDRINASLREQQNLLARIHQQQQLINAQPFLSADQKQALSRASMIAEMAALGGAIARTKRELSNSALDPLTHEHLQTQLQRDQAEFDALHLKISAIDHPFATELVAWVNQLGTTAHQVAGVLTGTLQTAIDGISQSITGLIVGTKDWEQAWNNAVVSIIGGIVKMVVQWIAGQVAMFAIRQIFGRAEDTTTSKMATSAAAKWAPAAISASIASYGAASGFGVAAYIAALAAGEAAAMGASAIGGAGGGGGGFAKGGRTGRGPKFATVGEEGEEFVFTAKATRNIGIDRLYSAMHAAENAPHFGDGGRVDWGGSHYGSNPRTLEPPYGHTPYVPGGFRWTNNPNEIPTIIPALEPQYTPLGDIDLDIPPANPADPYSTPTPAPTPRPTPSPPPRWTDNTGLIGRDVAYAPRPTVVFPNLPVNFANVVPAWTGPVDPGNILVGPPQVGTTNVNTGIGEVVMWNGTDWVNLGPVPTPGLVPDPSRTYGGFIDPATGLHLTVTGYDPNTGTTFYQDDKGKSYATGPSSPRENLPGGGSGTATPVGTHWDFTRGTYVSNNFAGGAQFSSQAANALQMWFQSMGGTPNTPTVSDAGRDIFRSGHGRLDPEGGGIIPVAYTNTFSRRDPRWVFPSQEESARLGLSFDVNKRNAWLIEHNQWFYGAEIPGGADGLRIPGPASRADNILAWLSTGERVINADLNLALEKRYGFDWDKHIPIETPRFAAGGRVSPSVSSASSRAGVRATKIIVVADARAAAREAQREPEYESHVVDILHRNRHELALPAAQ
jgi:hypothetical protein